MSRAALYDRVGTPEVLYLGEVADQDPGPGEVAVRVRAAGLNPFDGKLRSGFIPSDAPFPRRAGSDLAGTVAAVGADAVYWDGTPVAVGDEFSAAAPAPSPNTRSHRRANWRSDRMPFRSRPREVCGWRGSPPCRAS